MAITYPYPVSFLADRLNIDSVTWDIKRNDEMSGSGDGRVWQAELAPPLWTGDVALNIGDSDELKQIAALIRKLQGAQEQFYLYDPLSKFPQAYPDGNFWPGESFANLLVNPGFETGMTSWLTGAGLSASSAFPRTGINSLILDKGAASGGTARTTFQTVNVVPGKQYRLSAWIGGGGAASTAGFYLKTAYFDASNAQIGGFANTVNNVGFGTAYSQVSGLTTAPAGAATMRFYINYDVSGTAQSVAVDDVSFARYETFTGSAQINSIGTGGRTISLKGVPSGYKLTLADKLQVAYASSPVRNAFLEVDENIVADGTGVTGMFEVFPNAPAGVAVNDVVTLLKPACKVFIMPQSHNPGSAQGLLTSGAAFKVMEKR